MQAFATEVITRAALAAGLPEGRVIDMVKKDNLTIKRPRIELQFMPETLTRTGRTLNVCRQSTDQIRKRELYEVELTVNANILADDRAWLERFSYDFVAALSSGGNDSRGNWIRVRASQATFGRAPDKRVGEKVIAVFTRVNRLYVVTFTGRITREEAEELIPSHTINEPTFYSGGRYGYEKENSGAGSRFPDRHGGPGTGCYGSGTQGRRRRRACRGDDVGSTGNVR